MKTKTIAGVAIVAALAIAPLSEGVASTRCNEDQPTCWNWRTMGNHQRGIITIGGRHLVVNAKRFDRLNRTFSIDWSHTEYLRGDGHRDNVQDY